MGSWLAVFLILVFFYTKLILFMLTFGTVTWFEYIYFIHTKRIGSGKKCDSVLKIQWLMTLIPFCICVQWLLNWSLLSVNPPPPPLPPAFCVPIVQIDFDSYLLVCSNDFEKLCTLLEKTSYDSLQAFASLFEMGNFPSQLFYVIFHINFKPDVILQS